MNKFLNGLMENDNYTLTENCAVTHKSTMNKVYDMFAMGGAYRKRSEEDICNLFANAYEENSQLALKCLFYLRDIRGGQGERRFFRTCYHWLAQRYPDVARKNLALLSEYGRYDDMWYSTFRTPLEKDTLHFIKDLLTLDINCKAPSLLAKWLPSENASSATTKWYAKVIREYLGMTSKQYRKTLSYLREKINVLERLMSAGEWDKIEFDKIPSKAGLKYRNAFARRDMIAKKYKDFIEDANTKVNADTIYPYECVQEARKLRDASFNDINRVSINKYWDNLKDYFDNKVFNGLVMCDTSSSMTWGMGSNSTVKPIDVAVSLALYCADKGKGPFAKHFMTFESEPHMIEVHGKDLVDKVRNVMYAPWGGSTNIAAAMELILSTAIENRCSQDELPENLIIVSDMEFDYCCRYDYNDGIKASLFDNIKAKFERWGFKMPKLFFWNVDARQDNIPMKTQDGVTFISGFSPVTFEMIMSGKTSMDLMLEKLNSERYAAIEV